MAWNISYEEDGNFTKCKIQLTNTSKGNYKAGSYIVIDNASSPLLVGAGNLNYDPTNEVIVLLIVEEHSTFPEEENLEFTIRAKACNGGGCKKILGVAYVYSSNPNTKGAKEKKRSHPVASNELGGGDV